MGSLLIRNGRLLDPARNLDAVQDLWIVDGRFAAHARPVEAAEETLDAHGMLVMPGLVDAHVHLREPGNEEAETIASGCAAALAGGFTSIICMPNTTPALDTPERLRWVLDRAEAQKGPRVYAMGAITLGREGVQVADLEALARAGAVAFTDDGNCVQEVVVIREAMERAARLRRPIVEHCEDTSLAAGGVMHEGIFSNEAGLPGVPSFAEAAMVQRDIVQSELTGAALHLQHVSAAESVALIAEAVAREARVTAEVTPHHLLLTDQDAVRGGTHFKMNPPLRSEEDRRALVEALRDGALEVIATDHAPHTAEAKARGFLMAPAGVIGMETAAALVWTHLVQKGLLTPLQMVARMSAAPAEVFGLAGGTLLPGRPADVTIFDPNAGWTVNPDNFQSRARNCPFAGWRLQGRVAAVIVAGEMIRRDGLR